MADHEKENRERSLRVFREMGCKPFWESPDQAVFCYGQLRSGLLLESQADFRKRLCQVLERDIDFNNFSVPQLIAELRDKFGTAYLESEVFEGERAAN